MENSKLLSDKKVWEIAFNAKAYTNPVKKAIELTIIACNEEYEARKKVKHD